MEKKQKYAACFLLTFLIFYTLPPRALRQPCLQDNSSFVSVVLYVPDRDQNADLCNRFYYR